MAKSIIEVQISEVPSKHYLWKQDGNFTRKNVTSKLSEAAAAIVYSIRMASNFKDTEHSTT